MTGISSPRSTTTARAHASLRRRPAWQAPRSRHRLRRDLPRRQRRRGQCRRRRHRPCRDRRGGAVPWRRNPMPAAGGVDPEDVEAVRRDAPAGFPDPEARGHRARLCRGGRASREVQRAAASFRWTGSWHTVFVSADRFGGGPIDAAFNARLRRQLERFRMAGYDLEIVAPLFVPLDVALHVCAQAGLFPRPTSLKRVGRVLSSAALPDGSLGLFHPDRLSFGAARLSQPIIAAAQAVEGVDSVHAERFQRLVDPDPLSLDLGIDRDRRAGSRAARQQSELPRARPARPVRRRRQMTAPVPDLKRNVAPPCRAANAATAATASRSRRRRRSTITTGFRASPIASAIMPGSGRACTPRLSSSDYGFPPGTVSALTALQTREDDDFTIALIDAFACSADVLTFYQERIATESYLRTAVERVSIQEMGKLVGYRLKPGLAAETWLAFALETPPAPPPNLPPEPGNFVTGVPASLTARGRPQGAERARSGREAADLRAGRDARRRAARMECDPPVAERGTFPGHRRQRGLAGRNRDLAQARRRRCCSSARIPEGDRSPAQWDFRPVDAVEPDDGQWSHPRLLDCAACGGARAAATPCGGVLRLCAAQAHAACSATMRPSGRR